MKILGRTLLTVVIASTVALSLTGIVAGCGKGAGGATTVTTGSTGGKPTTQRVRVGEQVAVGDVRVLVPVSTLTATPARPMYPVATVSGVRPGPGETYYQAVVRIENAGQKPVRVDPRDFSAMVGRASAPLDISRSGPEARTLLHGTSLELILTFVVPDGAEPDLVHHPSWLNGTLVFVGQQKPAGAL
ncbi:MAG: hypothetical protein BWY79_01313 [Actinobacteria bacterium ADurb.Bin444]|nr:MAG: hypothetical protein BWY79_01313 [Actinobacteria bacterium ADurb.Bin444]